MYEMVAFYFFSILTIGFFMIAVFSKNALYAMSSLAGGMVFIAGFFFLLDAEFLGVVQIIVYTGAIMAIYAFGMMFFDTSKSVEENIVYKKIIYTLFVFSIVLITIILIAPIYSQSVTDAFLPIDESLDNTRMIGRVLFTKYLVAFELTAIMLLVAMISGIVLAGKRMNEETNQKKIQGEEI